MSFEWYLIKKGALLLKLPKLDNSTSPRYLMLFQAKSMRWRVFFMLNMTKTTGSGVYLV
jgi:hypothetical protein